MFTRIPCWPFAATNAAFDDACWRLPAGHYRLIHADLMDLRQAELPHLGIGEVLAEYERRLGGWDNLPGYARCLAAGAARDLRQRQLAHCEAVLRHRGGTITMDDGGEWTVVGSGVSAASRSDALLAWAAEDGLTRREDWP